MVKRSPAIVVGRIRVEPQAHEQRSRPLSFLVHLRCATVDVIGYLALGLCVVCLAALFALGDRRIRDPRENAGVGVFWSSDETRPTQEEIDPVRAEAIEQVAAERVEIPDARRLPPAVIDAVLGDARLAARATSINEDLDIDD